MVMMMMLSFFALLVCRHIAKSTTRLPSSMPNKLGRSHEKVLFMSLEEAVQTTTFGFWVSVQLAGKWACLLSYCKFNKKGDIQRERVATNNF